ncbi:MAG TPA: hypothetical protein VK605_04615 [Solirubrobacteraceae bacterium]|nr:hypothetical protein [Solirubrobacteraceae bacterium]
MAYSDSASVHNAKLVEAARSKLGVTGVRVFESSEGSLSPMTITEAEVAVEQIRDALGKARQEAKSSEQISLGDSA